MLLGEGRGTEGESSAIIVLLLKQVHLQKEVGAVRVRVSCLLEEWEGLVGHEEMRSGRTCCEGGGGEGREKYK